MEGRRAVYAGFDIEQAQRSAITQLTLCTVSDLPDVEHFEFRTSDRGPDMIKPVVDAVEASAAVIKGVSFKGAEP